MTAGAWFPVSCRDRDQLYRRCTTHVESLFGSETVTFHGSPDPVLKDIRWADSVHHEHYEFRAETGSPDG